MTINTSVHPVKTEGRAITDLAEAYKELGLLLQRKFNEDFMYRVGTDEPIHEVYYGEPFQIQVTPSISVELLDMTTTKGPQDSGGSGLINWKVRYYAGAYNGREEILFQTVRASAALKLIIQDNYDIPTADGTRNFVFNTTNQDFVIEFGVISDDEGESGIQIAELRFSSTFDETGY